MLLWSAAALEEPCGAEQLHGGMLEMWGSQLGNSLPIALGCPSSTRYLAFSGHSSLVLLCPRACVASGLQTHLTSQSGVGLFQRR